MGNLGSSREKWKPPRELARRPVEIVRERDSIMATSAPMNIPVVNSRTKDSSNSNSSSLSSSFGSSSITSSPVHSSFNPPCPNCSSSSCTAAFNPSFSPCSNYSRMSELSASTRRKRTSSWSNVWNSMARNKLTRDVTQEIFQELMSILCQTLLFFYEYTTHTLIKSTMFKDNSFFVSRKNKCYFYL